jgi:hypothetical protein
MRRVQASVIAVAVLLGAAPLAHAGEAEGPKPGVLEAKLVTVTATVQAIDYDKRTVTLKGPRRTVTLKIGPEAKNFDQVKQGDQVKVAYVDSVAVFVRKPDAPPSAQEADVVQVSPRGAKPGVMAVSTRELTATVVGINYKDRTVDLKGPGGVTLRLPVDKGVQGFEDVKKGDQVVVRHTEAVAIDVRKP